MIDLILDIRADYTESSTKPWMEVSIEILDPSRLTDFFTAGRHHKRPTPAGPITSLQAVSAITRRLQPRRRKIGKIMDNNTVLSLSSDQAILTSREIALRSGGLKVVSVMSPIQARFEIEMGMCGIFLACYRVSKVAVDDLTRLFRNICPEGLIIFVSEVPGDDRVPTEADIALPESSGPEKIVQAMKQCLNRDLSFDQPGSIPKERSARIR